MELAHNIEIGQQALSAQNAQIIKDAKSLKKKSGKMLGHTATEQAIWEQGLETLKKIADRMEDMREKQGKEHSILITRLEDIGKRLNGGHGRSRN